MALIAPPKPRSVIDDSPERLEITIPVRTNVFAVVFLGIWLLGWAVGEIAVPLTFFSGKGLHVPFVVLWLVGWTLGGAFAILIFFYQIAGREVVRVDGKLLSTRTAVGRLGRSKEFDRSQVKNLRIAVTSVNMFDPAAAFQFWGLTGGNIAFDYGARTFRFGRNIDEPEARRLIEAIERRT